MASQAKPDMSSRFLTAEELLAIRGTPEFEVEFRRQLSAIAEHDRKTGNSARLEVDWDALPEWE